MKKVIGLLLVVLVAGASAAVENDITATMTIVMPSDDEVYDNGYGGEIQARFWNGAFGVALAAGASSWDVKDQLLLGYEVSGSAAEFGGPANWSYQGELYGAAEGSVFTFPLGGSLLIKQEFADKGRMVLEGGIRYVIVSSDFEASGVGDALFFDEFGTPVFGVIDEPFSETVEIDNGLVGLIAANIEADISESVMFIASMGYQFDLMKGDVEFWGEKLAENELEAFFIRFGLGVNF